MSKNHRLNQVSQRNRSWMVTERLESRELLAGDVDFVRLPVCLAEPPTVSPAGLVAADSNTGGAGTGDAGTGHAGTGDAGTGDAGTGDAGTAENDAALISGLEQSSGGKTFAASSEPSYPALNLAKFQTTLVDSVANGTIAAEATDGIVSNESRWTSQNAAGPHWVEVQLPAAYPVGSAQVYLGVDNTNSTSSFEIQYHDGSAWQTAVSVSGDNSTDHHLVFPSTIENATRYRIFTTENFISVKEFVLLPPGGPSGHPMGTGVDLNLGSRLKPGTSTFDTGHYAVHAVDGYVSDDSRWLSRYSATETHRLVLQIPTSNLVGSVHLYTGFTNASGVTINPLDDFNIDYSNNFGSSFTPVPGGTVSSGVMSGNSITGNSSSELVIQFASPVMANRIRITFTNNLGRVREMVALPANTGADGPGYPLGTSVKFESPPTESFTDYGDAWYRIVSRSNNRAIIADENGASQTVNATPEVSRQYQVMYSYAHDAYRIRAEDSAKALQVKDASFDAGAAIVEGDFSAAPHQLWKLEATSDGHFQFVNVWSGMALQTGGAYPNVVTQQPIDTAADPVNQQEWRLVFQDDFYKKGVASTGDNLFGGSWSYNWNRNDGDPYTDQQFYAPMQFRRYWPGLGALHQEYSEWNQEIKPSYLLGFNEPDREDQANMGVTTGVTLWPQLLAMDVPLVSPANAHGAIGQAWLEEFSDRTDALGFRMDYAAAHWYSSPNVNGILNYVDTIQNKSNGRDVWMTEFSVVDWSGGSGNWSEETNYNFILEFLYRAESKANLNKYSLFLWTGAEPATPWAKSNPRSNFFISNSNKSLTPFGKAYAGWDGETAVADETLYVIHNRQAAHRMQNNGGPDLEEASIRVEDDSVQWIVQDAGNDEVFLTSAVDGRRAKLEAGNIVMAAPGSSGWGVRWKIQQDQYGWQNIVHAGSGNYLRLNRVNDASGAPTSQTFGVVSASAASNATNTDWWFVKPYERATGMSPVSDSDQSINAIAEHLPADTYTGVIAEATGLVATDTISYSLSNDAGGRFQIDSLTGAVTTMVPLDYSDGASHTIEVQAISSDGSVNSESFTVNVIESVPPAVEEVQVNDGGDQRSSITKLVVRFDGVVDAPATAFSIENLDTLAGSTLVPAAGLLVESTIIDGKTVSTITFAEADGIVSRPSGNSLMDGNYRLRIDGSQIVVSGTLNAMSDDFQFGDQATDQFFRFFGDSDGDRDVDGQDYGRFGLAFLTSEGQPRFDAALDFDGDGDVDGQDYGKFGLRFLQSLPY